MTTQLPIREQIKPAIELMKAFVAEDQSTYGMAAQVLIDFALAAHEQEPGEYLTHVIDDGYGEFSDKMNFSLPVGTKLYTHSAPVPAVSIPEGLHPDTKKLICDFASALAEKLYKAQLKYGYSDNWKRGDWSEQCLQHFHQHIGKGDPRDVAAYCAFMWFHGWKTELQAPVPAVPGEATPGNVAMMASTYAPRGVTYQWDTNECNAAADSWNACRGAMLNGGKS